MENDEELWLPDIERKINAIRTRVDKINASYLDLDELLRLAFIIDNKIKYPVEKERIKAVFETYLNQIEYVSIHNPEYIHKGARERKSIYIQSIKNHLYKSYKYRGRNQYRIDYLTYAIILSFILNVCSAYRILYWDMIASCIVCAGAFAVGFMIDKRNKKKGLVI